jgi:hypothetical protein
LKHVETIVFKCGEFLPLGKRKRKRDATICPKDFFGKEALKELKSPYLDDRFLCVASI